MNVLYVGFAQGFQNADKFYLLPQKLINGLIRTGHNVYIFNDRDFARYSNIFRTSRFGVGAVNRKLLEVCKQFQPKLIILAHCEMIANETLDEIRSLCDGVKIVYRNVDPLCSQRNVNCIKRRIGHVDGTFITTAGDVLKQFSHPKSFICFMPNLVDVSIETSRSFDSNDCDIDLFFAGHIYREMEIDYRRNDINILMNSLKGIRYEFIGVFKNSPCVFGQDYMNLLSRSKMGLCINKV